MRTTILDATYRNDVEHPDLGIALASPIVQARRVRYVRRLASISAACAWCADRGRVRCATYLVTLHGPGDRCAIHGACRRCRADLRDDVQAERVGA